MNANPIRDDCLTVYSSTINPLHRQKIIFPFGPGMAVTKLPAGGSCISFPGGLWCMLMTTITTAINTPPAIAIISTISTSSSCGASTVISFLVKMNPLPSVLTKPRTLREVPLIIATPVDTQLTISMSVEVPTVCTIDSESAVVCRTTGFSIEQLGIGCIALQIVVMGVVN